MTGTQQLNTTKRLQKNMEQRTSVWSGVHFPSRINCSCTVERTKKRSSCFKKQKHIGVKKNAIQLICAQLKSSKAHLTVISAIRIRLLLLKNITSYRRVTTMILKGFIISRFTRKEGSLWWGNLRRVIIRIIRIIRKWKPTSVKTQYNKYFIEQERS